MGYYHNLNSTGVVTHLIEDIACLGGAVEATNGYIRGYNHKLGYTIWVWMNYNDLTPWRHWNESGCIGESSPQMAVC